MLGLCGAHGTGKTTLAKAFAERHKLRFVETHVSKIIEDAGFDVRGHFTFAERIIVQRLVLAKTVEQVYRNTQGNSICDRTPLDMLAYTLAEVRGDSLDAEQEKELEVYTWECITATNDFFSVVALVQPGIPIIDRPGKAAPSRGYMEHLNQIMMGLMIDARIRSKNYYLPRGTIDLDKRVASLSEIWRTTLERLVVFRQAFESPAHGSAVH